MPVAIDRAGHNSGHDDLGPSSTGWPRIELVNRLRHFLRWSTKARARSAPISRIRRKCLSIPTTWLFLRNAEGECYPKVSRASRSVNAGPIILLLGCKPQLAHATSGTLPSFHFDGLMRCFDFRRCACRYLVISCASRRQKVTCPSIKAMEPMQVSRPRSPLVLQLHSFTVTLSLYHSSCVVSSCCHSLDSRCSTP